MVLCFRSESNNTQLGPDGRTSPNFAPAVAVGTRRNAASLEFTAMGDEDAVATLLGICKRTQAPSKARTLQNSSEGFARDSKVGKLNVPFACPFAGFCDFVRFSMVLLREPPCSCAAGSRLT